MWQFTVLVFMFAPPSPIEEKYVSSTSPPPAPAPSPSRDNSGRLASNGRNPRRRPVRNGNMMSSKPCILIFYTDSNFYTYFLTIPKMRKSPKGRAVLWFILRCHSSGAGSIDFVSKATALDFILFSYCRCYLTSCLWKKCLSMLSVELGVTPRVNIRRWICIEFC